MLDGLATVDLDACVDPVGFTPLMFAAIFGHHEVVQALIPRSDLKAQDHDGWTPLMCAVYNDHGACVEALLAGSDLNQQDKNGWTALMHALRASPACLAFLAPLSNLDLMDRQGRTALRIAGPWRGKEAFVAVLLAEERRRITVSQQAVEQLLERRERARL